MKIIRITLKEGGESKVILFKQEKQNSSRMPSSESGKASGPKRKEALAK